ncbi:hypothetical protein [Natrinema salsiterrestre]|uniref:Uncharacterized protein n=1 Tax=Natrinema salsiterrestre TaxID=2950540 RepID=A0A9Q4Q123_9EURY|nr:hypothetical protein [Natrinema salsiterrestre]MDF9744991.1 hypothetical protein [Natrinema salsiterrestre]
MKGPGILWMLQTVAGMSMAGPMFILGANRLLSGRYAWGIGFLLFGGVVLYFPTYLVNRIDGPRTRIRRRIGRSDENEVDTVAGNDGDSAADGTDGTTDVERGTDEESTDVPLLGRLRDR